MRWGVGDGVLPWPRGASGGWPWQEAREASVAVRREAVAGVAAVGSRGGGGRDGGARRGVGLEDG